MKLVKPRKNIDHSKRCKRFHVTLGWELTALGLALAVFMTLVFLSGPPPKSKEDHEYTNPNSFKKNKVSESEVTASQIPSSFCTAGCDVTSNNEEQNSRNISNNFYKDKRDLNAQEGVWRASNVMAFFSLVMTVLTIAGVYLLVLTWKATQSTMKFASETLDQSRVATKAAIDAATATERATNETMKAQKAHIFPLLTARFDEEAFTGGIPLSGQVRQIKSKIIVEVRVCNLGKTPVRGGTVTSRKMSDKNTEVKRPFNALAAGQESTVLRQIKYSLSELIDFGRESSEIITVSEFVDIDGNTPPVLAGWGDIQFTDSNNRKIARQTLAGLDTADQLALIKNVEVAVRYVEAT